MWLIEREAKEKMEQAYGAGLAGSVQHRIAYEAAHGAGSAGSSRILSIAGKTARIEVAGTLTDKPSFMAQFFGGGNTTYPEIISALAEAEAAEHVENIVLAVDSPGGTIAGLFEAVEALQATTKPIEARVSNLGASAAFALATQADTIVAENRATLLGSVGIVATFLTFDDEVTITSTDAPKKAPDVTTEKGRAVVQENLDAIHDLFVEAIATGRGVSKDKVNSKFGQGGVVLADEAVKRGMIDRVAAPRLAVVPNTVKADSTANKGGVKMEAKKMDVETLQAEHPALYQAILADGIAQGQATERDRVVGHLHLGKTAGAMDVAIEAVNSGDGMTVALQAKYMSAGMNRSDIQARNDDDADANAGDSANAPAANDDAEFDSVSDKVTAAFGGGESEAV